MHISKMCKITNVVFTKLNIELAASDLMSSKEDDNNLYHLFQ